MLIDSCDNLSPNEKCLCCGVQLNSFDLALSKKLMGRDGKRLECLNCIALFFNVSTDKIKEKARYFKNDGCSLFIAIDVDNY